MIIFIYGDSITQGLWDSKGGWADRVKAAVQAYEVDNGIKDYNKVFSLGVDGNTAELILERFDNETKARLWDGEEYAFIFATGTNDSLHRKQHLSKIEYETSEEEYRNSLNKLVARAKEYSDRNIFFIEIPPVDEGKTTPLESSSTGKCYDNDRITKFNIILHAVCRENHIPCIRIYDEFKAKGEEALLIDGVHPNDDGHEFIYSKVMPKVRQLLKF